MRTPLFIVKPLTVSTEKNQLSRGTQYKTLNVGAKMTAMFCALKACSQSDSQ